MYATEAHLPTSACRYQKCIRIILLYMNVDSELPTRRNRWVSYIINNMSEWGRPTANKGANTIATLKYKL